MTRRPGSTRAWRELRARILKASDVCHLCGRPGADAVDHKVPVDVAPEREMDPTNLAPAHHDVWPKCNRRKGANSTAPVVRTSRDW